VFFPRTTPLSLAPAQVRGLRLSLNTPVVATEDLPIGPARAAILVHAEAGRGETVTIGIRSLRADRVALYGIEGDEGGGASLDVAVDAALTFAESMGFLFDEDEIGSAGASERRRCHGLWRELLGEDAPASRRGARPIEPEEPDELLLEELAEEATEVVAAGAAGFESEEDDEELGGFGPPLAGSGRGAAELDASLEPEPPDPELLDPSDAEVVAQVARAAGGGGRAPALPLTKFRGGAPVRAPRAPEKARAGARPEPAAAAAEPRPRRAKALGKLRLVRRIRDGVRRRNPLLRLFGAF
jgi:hypothetical protein